MSRQFAWDAKDYAQSSEAQLIWARELIDKLRLTGSERVLDLGCGDGKATALIAERVPQGLVVGADYASGMIALAQETFGGSGPSNLRFELADARELPYTEQFDLVFSNAVLHWVLDHRPVLQGIARALVPGGRILLQMGGEGNAAEIIGGMAEMAADPRWGSFFVGMGPAYGFYGPQDYAPWLREAGFEATRLELMPKDMTQRGIEGLEGWIRTTWLPYTSRVPEGLREAFVHDVATRYVATHPADARGLVHVAMVRLEVEARKLKQSEKEDR